MVSPGTWTVDVVVPEPATFTLVASGLIAFGVTVRDSHSAATHHSHGSQPWLATLALDFGER